MPSDLLRQPPPSVPFPPPPDPQRLFREMGVSAKTVAEFLSKLPTPLRRQFEADHWHALLSLYRAERFHAAHRRCLAKFKASLTGSGYRTWDDHLRLNRRRRSGAKLENRR